MPSVEQTNLSAAFERVFKKHLCGVGCLGGTVEGGSVSYENEQGARNEQQGHVIYLGKLQQ